jgi:hypothetical protein
VKNSAIGIRTRDVAACGPLPQPTAPPRASESFVLETPKIFRQKLILGINSVPALHNKICDEIKWRLFLPKCIFSRLFLNLQAPISYT